MDYIIDSNFKRRPSFDLEENVVYPTNTYVNEKHLAIKRVANTSNSTPKSKKAKKSSYDIEDDAESLESAVSEILEYFSGSSSDETNTLSISDMDEQILIDDGSKYPVEDLVSQPNFELENALKCPNHHGKIALPWNISSRVVAKLDDVVAVRHDRMIITSASDLFHIEWCNAAWSQFTGWSADEVLGLDCSFLQGVGTDKSVVSAFTNMLEMSGGFADMTIVNYTKSHTAVRNTIHCFPITDNCGFSNLKTITHIGVVLLESQEVQYPNFCDEIVRRNPDLQFDRRNQSRCFALMSSIAPPHPMEWITLTRDFTISLMLRYTLRCRAPILIVDGDGRIIHTNKAWVQMTRLRHAEVESVPILSMFGPKSKSSDLKKLESLFQNDSGQNFEFKRPISSKSVCQLELHLKKRSGPMLDAFKDFVFKTPAQLAQEKALLRSQGIQPECAFCKIYDDNAEKMSKITETFPVYASVSRFNSEHYAILFNERYIV